MENKLENQADMTKDFTGTGKNKISFPSEKPVSNVKTINLSGDQLVVTNELSGVYFGGVQYYDFMNIHYINNTGMANLIDFLKSLLEKAVEVQFMNVNDKIKNKIKSMGLEHILHCG